MLTRFDIIICPSQNVEKHPNNTITNIFLNMYDIKTKFYIKTRPIKISLNTYLLFPLFLSLEYFFFLPNTTLILYSLIDFFSGQGTLSEFILFAHINSFFQPMIHVITFDKSQILKSYSLPSMFQLMVTHVFYTNRTYFMSLNTIPRQIPVF